MALFEPEYGLMFWMLVSFLLLLGILAKFAWPVIIKSMEERAKFIADGITYAREALEKRHRADEEAAALLAETRQQQLKMMQETQQMRQQIVSEARVTADAEAQKILEAARIGAEQTRQEAELQIRKRVALLSLDIAGKILRKDLAATTAQTELVNSYMDELVN